MDSDNAFLFSFSLCLVLLCSFLPKLWEKIGEIPLKNTIVVLLIAGSVTIGGISIFSEELGKGHFRIVYLPNIEVLNEAFDRIERFLLRHRN